jgi:hypothetical protein
MGGLEMTREEGIQILQRLAASYSKNTLGTDAGREEYLRFIMPLDYDRAIDTLDKVFMNFKQFPSIAEFRATYTSTMSRTNTPDPFVPKCKTCSGAKYIFASNVCLEGRTGPIEYDTCKPCPTCTGMTAPVSQGKSNK